MTLNVEKSREIAEKIEASSKDCYRNSLLAVLTFSEMNGSYVEGFALDGKTPFPYDHAWVELPNGEVLDPTWVLTGAGKVLYFPAVKWSLLSARELVGVSLPIGNLRDSRYQEAFKKVVEALTREREEG